ncbi:AAA family ATPase [Streptomyces niveus]|uniref:AAA family ATPase n=1 Tax=Streptomyces niveus TaxID=193462 RepID=UPI0033E873FE
MILENFRGVKSGTVLLDGHSLLVGSNSVGKSTVCEGLELVLGPERRSSPDFGVSHEAGPDGPVALLAIKLGAARRASA